MLCVVLLVLSATTVLASEFKNTCRKDQHTCLNGSCIALTLKCDGVADCFDGSDETHALCWNNKCKADEFRCAYGACVNGTAPCNNIPACVDFSDELLPKCRNEHLENSKNYKCHNGKFIPETNRCDGVRDCADGSDETLWACAGMVCPEYLFQCAYGACVDKGAACNKVNECADRSDEAVELCENLQRFQSQPIIGPEEEKCVLPPYPKHGTFETQPNAKPGDAFDLLIINITCNEGYGVDVRSPVLCYNGIWSDRIPDCVPQCHLTPHPSVEYHCMVSETVEGLRTCNEYEVMGTLVRPRCRRPYYYSPKALPVMHCLNGEWNYTAKCIPDCGKDVRIRYVPFNAAVNGYLATLGEVPWHAGIYTKTAIPYKQICGGSLISKKIIITECGTRTPYGTSLIISGGHRVILGEVPWHAGIYNKITMPFKQICGGSLIRKNIIISECGTETSLGDVNTSGAGGVEAILGEVPWHAGIYVKATMPYKQICGGTLISKNIIISAAHCFWSNVEGKQLPAANYAVAVGKIFRSWNNSMDDEAQKSDIKEIHVPVHYQGSTANYQDDIAVVVVTNQFEYKRYIRPVCVDFEFTFEKKQLENGYSFGKVAGWGLTNVTSMYGSPFLTVLELPYVATKTCIADSPASFRAFITSDKFCAGYKDGNKAVCQGDSGGGLAFPEQDRGQQRYYLRGIVSTAPESLNQDTCNANTYTAFTQLRKHEHFIRQFWEPL